MKKIYSIDFIKYTNNLYNTVTDNNHEHYIEVGKDPFLICEDEIEYYMKFGGGIKNMIFVGYMEDKK